MTPIRFLLILCLWITTAVGNSKRVGYSSSSESPNSSGGETEYVYEYYEEPDYAVYPPKPTIKSTPFEIPQNNQGRSVHSHHDAHNQKFTLHNAKSDEHLQPRLILSGDESTSSSKEDQTRTHTHPVPVQQHGGGGETEEYEYVYEEEIPSPEIQTQVSVSVSASSVTPTPQPGANNKKSPESGVVISVATTKSIFNPTTSPTTTITSTIPNQKASSTQNPTTRTPSTEPSTTSKISTTTIQPEPPSSSFATSSSSTSAASSPAIEGIKFEDVSKFLPPDYKKPIIIPKIQFAEISPEFLPKGYVMSTTPSTTTTASTTTTTASTTTTTEEAAPKNPLEALMKKIKFEENIAQLLPPGYKPIPETESTTQRPQPSSTTLTLPVVVSTTGQPKVVYPTRAGGAKLNRPTTTEHPKPETPSPPKVNLKQGWPTRKTTEFTGWPTISTTPSTTPIPPPTTPPPPTSSTTPSTTTVKTTTELPPPLKYPTTFCEVNTCKMEATMRLVGGVRWKPEYADINTEEYKQLENTVKRELDGAYRSSGLAPFYRSIEIEAFNEGSVLVDYFLFLDNVDREISSDQIRSLFHGTLLQGDDDIQPKLKLGRYTIDPRFTDFKVRSIESESISSELEEALIPQWGIAVIVIGIASLIFVVIFAVTLVVSRQRKGGGVSGSSSKKPGVSLTQEMLSEFNKNHRVNNWGGVGGDSVGFYSGGDDGWEEPNYNNSNSRGHRSTPSRGYNIYDSWKTEWNGYPGHPGPGKPKDYDTNF